jgi:hypothetical protein
MADRSGPWHVDVAPLHAAFVARVRYDGKLLHSTPMRRTREAALADGWRCVEAIERASEESPCYYREVRAWRP